MRRIGRPSPALIVATAALIVSLTGVAGALPGTQTVDSGDIVNNTVKSKDLRDNGVKTKDIRNNHVGARDLAAVNVRPGDTVNVNDSPAGNGQNSFYAKGTSTATCNPGEQIIGGYGEFVSDPFLFDAMNVESESIDLGTNSYTARAGADSGEIEQFRAVAICLKR